MRVCVSDCMCVCMLAGARTCVRLQMCMCVSYVCAWNIVKGNT